MNNGSTVFSFKSAYSSFNLYPNNKEISSRFGHWGDAYFLTDPDDVERLNSAARSLAIPQLENVELDLRFNPEKQRTEIYLNGRMVEDLIRSMEVSGHVSFIATIPAVRRKMVEYQRGLNDGKGLVMDGRDIGTVVFPNAEMKIFLTASEEVRAMRRYKELIEKKMPADYKEVLHNIQSRDHIDSTRDDSPLKQADDAIVLDNSNMTVEEQMEWFREAFRQIPGRIDG